MQKKNTSQDVFLSKMFFITAKKRTHSHRQSKKKHVVDALKRDFLRHWNFNSAVFSREY
jgi:hypothetical protein